MHRARTYRHAKDVSLHNAFSPLAFHFDNASD
jgi:hypothetical protein